MNNNTVQLAGHVGQTPTQIEFASGKKVVKFSLAVKGAAGAEPMWVEIQAWNGLGDSVVKLITQGREVLLQGRLAIDEYTDKEGRKVKKPVINLNSFYLCGPKPTADDTDDDELLEAAS